MYANEPWIGLGWRHILWELVRYWCSVRGLRKKNKWLLELRNGSSMELPSGERLPVDEEHVELLFRYLEERNADFDRVFGFLRTEEEAVAFCDQNGISVLKTKTKTQQHHQSAKALVAAVSGIAVEVAEKRRVRIDTDPQTRCVWCVENFLHVTARNLDGAIPGLANPSVIWEIKEYWGKTCGGSKMSDAVYECNLVGRELREFEERAGCKVNHIVFVDGKDQWESRKSDLARFIDLTNQGLIDHLFVGREIEELWYDTLDGLLSS